MIFLFWPVAFFCAGLYEMKRAAESYSWPACPAKITSFQVLDGDESGGYVRIEGKFTDTGEPFTVRRWAYGAVNGLYSDQPYLSPYKPGYLTTVYVDPGDRSNVILCNDPSLTGNYMFMGFSGAAIIGIVWWLLLGEKKYEARQAKKKAAELHTSKRSGQAKEAPLWVGIFIGILFVVVFLGIGLWSLYMAYAGRSPAEVFSRNDRIFALLFGMAFSYGGVSALVGLILKGNIPPLLQRIWLSLFLFFLGLPFIVIPIIDPGGISSSTSVGGFEVSHKQGSSMGAVVFMLCGIGCMTGAFWPWRWWRKR